ncbi:hypothetical protein GCM10027414_15300 [Humibacter ginsengiterrae]
MQLSSTSTQRTYRHLRLAVIGAAVTTLVTLVVVTITVGPVSSLSALYYTPGGTAFTGALFGITLGLVALSGHSVEQVLLDIAAWFAALIAVLPTPIAARDAPGVAGLCPDGTVCVPTTAAAAATVGIVVVAVMGILTAIVAVWLAAVRHGITAGVVVPAAVVAAVSIAFMVWLGAGQQALLAIGHLVATGVFFCIMIVVSAVSAITARSPWRALYIVVTVGMCVSLVYLAVVFFTHLSGAGAGQPWILFGEVALIVFFAVFWIGQTTQKWNELDPALSR